MAWILKVRHGWQLRYLCCWLKEKAAVALGCCSRLLLITPKWYIITYLPHKAAAEVSKDKEPIGRGACGVQLIRKSIEIRLKWSEIQMILVVNWFGIQVIRLSIDSEFKWFGCRMIWDSSDLVVNWFEIQMIWLSIDVCFKWIWLSVDLRFKWAGCQLIWDSIDLVVNRFEVQMIWLSIDSRFKSWFSIDLRFKWFGC